MKKNNLLISEAFSKIHYPILHLKTHIFRTKILKLRGGGVLKIHMVPKGG